MPVAAWAGRDAGHAWHRESVEHEQARDGHNRPAALDELYRDNDVALYDLWSDPDELVNLANRGRPGYDPSLVGAMNAKLEALIEAELGEDPDLVERPVLSMGLAAFKRRRER